MVRDFYLDGKMTAYSGDTIFNYYHAGIAGVNEMKMNENGISVYPNPSNGKFKINSDTKSVNSVEIFDMTGNKIYSKAHLNQLDANVINISTVPKGVYFLRINKAGSG